MPPQPHLRGRPALGAGAVLRPAGGVDLAVVLEPPVTRQPVEQPPQEARVLGGFERQRPTRR
eukprot:824420-Prymnesium_polylepis.1